MLKPETIEDRQFCDTPNGLISSHLDISTHPQHWPRRKRRRRWNMGAVSTGLGMRRDDPSLVPASRIALLLPGWWFGTFLFIPNPK